MVDKWQVCCGHCRRVLFMRTLAAAVRCIRRLPQFRDPLRANAVLPSCSPAGYQFKVGFNVQLKVAASGDVPYEIPLVNLVPFTIEHPIYLAIQ